MLNDIDDIDVFTVSAHEDIIQEMVPKLASNT